MQRTADPARAVPDVRAAAAPRARVSVTVSGAPGLGGCRSPPGGASCAGARRQTARASWVGARGCGGGRYTNARRVGLPSAGGRSAVPTETHDGDLGEREARGGSPTFKVRIRTDRTRDRGGGPGQYSGLRTYRTRHLQAVFAAGNGRTRRPSTAGADGHGPKYWFGCTHTVRGGGFVARAPACQSLLVFLAPPPPSPPGHLLVPAARTRGLLQTIALDARAGAGVLLRTMFMHDPDCGGSSRS
ncbi:hypothetical protein BC628DRAFT_511453 [Trametes gibbosa]|nr:hypothetical protein BC628DRAFT_511453 [Trametes gibbosa]